MRNGCLRFCQDSFETWLRWLATILGKRQTISRIGQQGENRLRCGRKTMRLSSTFAGRRQFPGYGYDCGKLMTLGFATSIPQFVADATFDPAGLRTHLSQFVAA